MARSSKHTIDASIITKGGHCPTIRIAYSFLPGDPGCMYQRNGDPGWPPEPAEIDVLGVKLVDGDGLEPTQERMETWARQYVESDDGYSDCCDQAEYDRTPDPDAERDRRRDDQLTDG